MSNIFASLTRVADLGGPVVMILMGVSVLTLALVLYKLWQFRASSVGKHSALRRAIAAWDNGQLSEAENDLKQSRSYLAPLIASGFAAAPRERLAAEAEAHFAKLESQTICAPREPKAHA